MHHRIYVESILDLARLAGSNNKHAVGAKIERLFVHGDPNLS